MGDLPFSVSPEAAAYIEENLLRGDGNLKLAGLRPTLVQCFDRQTRDADGHLIERFDGESWGIGYHDPKEIEEKDYETIELGGRSLLIHGDGLRDLTGKRLVVELAGIDLPRPADTMRQVLRAV